MGRCGRPSAFRRSTVSPSRASPFRLRPAHLNGKDCRRDCLARRKVALKHVLKVRPSGVTYVGHVEVEGKALYARVCDLDPEGIGAKHKDSPYLTLLNERLVQESKQHSVDLKTL